MRRHLQCIAGVAVVLVALARPLHAGEAEPEEPIALAACACGLLERGTLTGGWFGLEDLLAERGISVALGGTGVYQHSLRGGLRKGRGGSTGGYQLEVETDLEPLLGLAGGKVFLAAEGTRGEGIDLRAVGSFFGIDATAGGDRSIDLVELWFQQSFLDDAVIVRLGKIDLTGGFGCHHAEVAFDRNAFACDERCDFLNGAFGGSATVPFPDNGFGFAILVHPAGRWYAAFGAADAEADVRESGFQTAFDGDSRFFYVVETGVVPVIPSRRGPLQGAYRFGLWHDRQRKEYLDGSGRTKHADTGAYFSGDQMLWLENDTADQQGLGVFARLGWADERVNEVRVACACGAQYAAAIPGRDCDLLGLGIARGRFSRKAGFGAPHEQVAELYYNVEVAPWLHVTPDLQWIDNPGGDRAVRDELVAGLRVQVDF